MDCFFSEFDMPVRWGLLRLKEMDVLNVVSESTTYTTYIHTLLMTIFSETYIHTYIHTRLQAALWISFLTDFTAIPPTDLGLRPDGTLRTCPVTLHTVHTYIHTYVSVRCLMQVQFHNCISSSSDPMDSDHYAPPFKWSRLVTMERFWWLW